MYGWASVGFFGRTISSRVTGPRMLGMPPGRRLGIVQVGCYSFRSFYYVECRVKVIYPLTLALVPWPRTPDGSSQGSEIVVHCGANLFFPLNRKQDSSVHVLLSSQFRCMKLGPALPGLGLTPG